MLCTSASPTRARHVFSDDDGDARGDGPQELDCMVDTYYPGQKYWDSDARQTTGACMLDRSRACTRWRAAVPIFLARVVEDHRFNPWRPVTFHTVGPCPKKAVFACLDTDVSFTLISLHLTASQTSIAERRRVRTARTGNVRVTKGKVRIVRCHIKPTVTLSVPYKICQRSANLWYSPLALRNQYLVDTSGHHGHKLTQMSPPKPN